MNKSKTKQQRDNAIINAVEDAYTQTEIAKYLKLSNSAISKIVLESLEVEIQYTVLKFLSFKISSKDELGVLAKSVNKMADFMVNANEISEAKVKRQTKLLRESNDKLKQNNQNLNTMIRSLSHDIKTPLTIMDGYLEECEDNIVLEKDMPKVIRILKKETKYLNELSSEAMYYIQSQELIVEKEEIALKNFIDVEIYPLLRSSKEVELKCEINDRDIVVFTDVTIKQK